MIKECQGCSLSDPTFYPVCFLFKALPDYELQNKCPCIECIVKPTCTQICKERSIFFKNLELVYSNQIFRVRYEFSNTKNIRKDRAL